MNILVTGANGLVGSAVVRRFAAENHNVKALCRGTADLSLLENLRDKISLIECDIMDVLALERAFEGIDVVIHTAAMVSFSPKERTEMYRINAEGTANVVNTCLATDVKKILFVSSVAALGRPSSLKITSETTYIDENQKWEDSPLNSHYAKSKYLAECEVWRGEAEGLEVAVVNPSVILGEGDWKRSSTQLFKYVYDQNKFYTLGSLNYVDIDDVTEAIYRLISKQMWGKRYIVSAGVITYKMFFDKVAAAFHKKSPSILIKPWMTEVLWRIEAFRSWISGSSPLITQETAKSARTHFHYQNERIKRELDLTFTPIEKTIERVANFLA